MPDLTTVYCLPVGTVEGDALLWDVATGKWLARRINTDDVDDRSDFPESTLSDVLNSIYASLAALSGAEAALVVAVTQSNPILVGGEAGSITITLTNNGSSDATGLTVQSTYLPSGKTTPTLITAGNTGVMISNGAKWTTITVAAGGSTVLSYNFNTAVVVSKETINNTTTVTGLSNTVTPLKLIPTGAYELTITKTAYNSVGVLDLNYAANQKVTFRLAAKNYGIGQTANNITIRDEIDDTLYDMTTFSSASGGQLVLDTGQWYVEWVVADNLDVPEFSGGVPGKKTVSYDINLEGTDVFVSGVTVITATAEITEVNGVAHAVPVPEFILAIFVVPAELSAVTVEFFITYLNDAPYVDTWDNPSVIGPDIDTGDKLTYRLRITNISDEDVPVDIVSAWTAELGMPINFNVAAVVDTPGRTATWTQLNVSADQHRDITFDQYAIGNAVPFDINNTVSVTDNFSVSPPVTTVVVKDFGVLRAFATPLLGVSTFVSAVGPSLTQLSGYLDQAIHVGDFVKVGINVYDNQTPEEAAFNIAFTETLAYGTEDFTMSGLTAGLSHDPVANTVYTSGLTIGAGAGTWFFYTLQVVTAQVYSSTITIDNYEDGLGVPNGDTPTDTLNFTVIAHENPPAAAKWIWDGTN